MERWRRWAGWWWQLEAEKGMASRGLHVFFPTTSCSLDTFFSRCPIFYLPELTFSSSTFWFKSVKDSCSFLCRYQCKAFFSPGRPHTTLLSWEHVNQLGVEEKRKSLLWVWGLSRMYKNFGKSQSKTWGYIYSREGKKQSSHPTHMRVVGRYLKKSRFRTFPLLISRQLAASKSNPVDLSLTSHEPVPLTPY